MTIVRKEKPMSAVQAQRLKLDKTVQNLELGKGRKATFTEGRKALQKATDNDNEGKVFKSPRFGVEGCCGKGCNGCLVFWHAPEYTKAREVLKEETGRNANQRYDRNFRRCQSPGSITQRLILFSEQKLVLFHQAKHTLSHIYSVENTQVSLF